MLSRSIGYTAGTAYHKEAARGCMLCALLQTIPMMPAHGLGSAREQCNVSAGSPDAQVDGSEKHSDVHVLTRGSKTTALSCPLVEFPDANNLC